MALSTPILLNEADNGGGGGSTTATTGSVSPSSDSLLVLVVGLRDNASIGSATITTTLSNVGSWTEIQGSQILETTNYRRLNIYWAKVTGNPGTGTITWNSDGASIGKILLHTIEVTGHDLTTPVPQNATASGTSTTLSTTLGSSPSASSIVLGGVHSAGSASIGVGSGFIELDEHLHASGTDILQSQYDETTPGTGCSWSTLSATANSGTSIEIKAAAAAPLQGAAGILIGL